MLAGGLRRKVPIEREGHADGSASRGSARFFNTEDVRRATEGHGGCLPVRLPGRHMAFVVLRGAPYWNLANLCAARSGLVPLHGGFDGLAEQLSWLPIPMSLLLVCLLDG